MKVTEGCEALPQSLSAQLRVGPRDARCCIGRDVLMEILLSCVHVFSTRCISSEATYSLIAAPNVLYLQRHNVLAGPQAQVGRDVRYILMAEIYLKLQLAAYYHSILWNERLQVSHE
jgi:hypothetical protein